jgi:hypothetical protein
MARVLAGLLAIVALWAAWWPIAAWREAGATEAWLDDRRAAGWLAEASDISVTGFPLSYVRRIEDVALADPASGWAWQAEGVALARPRHPELSDPGYVLTLPDVMEVQTPRERFSVASRRFVVTLLPAEGGDLLASARVDLDALEMASGRAWRTALASGSLVATADPEAPERVALVLTAAELEPPAAIARALSRADLVPRAIERLALEADVTFDGPWRLALLDGPRPQPQRIALDGSGLRWGDLTLRIAGTLTVDDAGRPEGELLLKATNWRELLAAAVAAGVIPERLAGGIEAGLELASRLAGSPQTLDIPLTFAGGRARIGPVPLGDAPVLRIP